MALELDSAIFGTVPEAKEGVNSVQGLPESFLAEIYQGEIPEVYTRQDIIEQTAAFIESRLTAVGHCVIRDMPNWVYHALGYISSTLLKGYAKNPHTCRKPYKAGDDANVGSGIHAFTLQGQEGFDTECAIMPPGCEGTSKAAKAAREEFALLHPGKAPLPHRYGTGPAETKIPIMDVLQGVDTSYRAHPKVSQILQNYESELSLVWIDEATGLTCKARLDIWAAPVIWDVKKTKDLDHFSFQIRDYFYNIQAGFYFNGAVACGLNPVAFGFLPCEAFPPYRVGCGYLNSEDPNKLEEARYEAHRFLGLIKESVADDYWPNFRAPLHIHSWGQMTPDDLIDVY